MIKLKCDLWPYAHEIVGKVNRVSHAEVKANARAYACMMCDPCGFPLEFKKLFERECISYATNGKSDLLGLTQSGDWACCDEHLAIWRSYCARMKQ